MLDIPTKRAELVGDLLIALAKEIVPDPLRPSARDPSRMVLRYGNLDISGYWRNLVAMPTTGLAVELVMLLTEMAKKSNRQVGSRDPLGGHREIR